MGKVVGAVRAHIPRGETIACVTPADALVTAGVSNWGGWGVADAVEVHVRALVADGAVAAAGNAPLAAAAAALAGAPPGALLPTDDEESAVLTAVNAAGGRDGITGALDGSVDGMPLGVHLAVLRRVRDEVVAAAAGVPLAAAAAAGTPAAGKEG
jgi:hypothetical protein